MCESQLDRKPTNGPPRQYPGVARLLSKTDGGLHEVLCGVDGLCLHKRHQEWEVSLAPDTTDRPTIATPWVAPRANPITLAPPITVTPGTASAKDVGVTVLIRGRGLVVVDKAFGQSTEAVIAQLQALEDSRCTPELTYRIRSVSRLDVPTSGALVVPLSARAEAHLTAQFKSHGVVRKVQHRADLTYFDPRPTAHSHAHSLTHSLTHSLPSTLLLL